MVKSSSSRQNNFDLLRLLGALLVIFSHSYAISGYGEPKLFFYPRETYGWLGVIIFFTISGYLITGSWMRRQHVGSYLKARALRIFPALILVVSLSIFILGPLVTTRSLTNYFTDNKTYQYFGTVFLYLDNNLPLPGVFEHNPIPVVNGSLWTLQYEFSLYLVILGLGSLLRAKLRYLLPVLILLMLPWYGTYRAGEHYLGNMNGFRILEFSSYFLLGACLFLYKKWIPLKPTLVGLAVALWTVITLAGKSPPWLLLPTLAYLIIFVALYQGLAFMHQAIKLERIGDISYGLYIFAFPIQGLVVWALHGQATPWQTTLLALPLIVSLAAASWHFLEKKALALK
ncbi:acyltransferase [Candidatus Beckwithbacteria bacterium]|nr:acyltransferase [Candidatus Beckwithbacteria bacterium]